MTYPRKRRLVILHEGIHTCHCRFDLGGPVVGLAWLREVDKDGARREETRVSGCCWVGGEDELGGRRSERDIRAAVLHAVEGLNARFEEVGLDLAGQFCPIEIR